MVTPQFGLDPKTWNHLKYKGEYAHHLLSGRIETSKNIYLLLYSVIGDSLKFAPVNFLKRNLW